MPRAKENKLYRTFVKGLITEASYLTYPEDASIDELNTVLSRKGNRTRRLGIDYENNHQLVDLNASSDKAISEHVWKAVDNVSTDNLLCLQIGTTVYFFSLEEAPVSDSFKVFSIDLTDYKAPGANDNDVLVNRASFSSGMGLLFIVHQYVEPLCVEYDEETDSITVTPILIQIRDFEGVYDGLANDQEPTTLSTEHHYNLLNQGWVSPGTVGADIGSTQDRYYIDPYTGKPVRYNPNTDPLPEEV